MKWSDIEAGTKFRYGYDKGHWITVVAITMQAHCSGPCWLCRDRYGASHHVPHYAPIKPPIKRKVK